MKNLLSFLLLCFSALPLYMCSQSKGSMYHATFEYREIYLPDRFTSEIKALKLDNVDTDWGLWGHNLEKVLPEEHSRSVYATIDGQNSDEQFCFSSDQLYKYIVEYIIEYCGEHKPQRFAILPNDNIYVCECKQCKEKGCTANDATPAVMSMLTRLASRFPKHTFFTSSYLTTRNIPSQPMPENTGVLISAIDYDLCAVATKQEEEFCQQLNKWSAVTKHVFVWDYINNFDDYITPFPIFTIMQRRFQLYKECGVTGVFLNGSGDDFSSFSRLKMHILTAMLEDPSVHWRVLLRQKCQELYPATGECVMQYILSQEDQVGINGKTLPLYQGAAVTKDIYLDEESFISFHDNLKERLTYAEGLEKQEMTQLYKALMLTRLELKRLHADTNGCNPMLGELAEVSDEGLRIYSESYWAVDKYVSDYRIMLREANAMQKKNRLQGVRLTALTALDNEYSDISVLTDGLIGLPSNYHCGHLISSADPALKIAIPADKKLSHLRVELAHNLQFHIALPLSVKLMAGNSEIGIVKPEQTDIAGRYTADFEVPANAKGTLVLTIERNKEERTMAIDEIMGW